MKKTSFIFLFVIIFHTLPKAQQNITKQGVTLDMTLDDAISLAMKQSLYSFRAKNMYLARYWAYRSYKATKLPALRLNTTPFAYSQSVSSEYDFNTGDYRFVPYERLSSNLGLTLQQNVTITGGTLSLESNARMIKNSDGDAEFTSVPFSINFRQPLNGYNKFRWMSRIEPLKFEKAKKDFLVELENIRIRVTDAFFNVVMSEINLKIAETNYSNADTLFRIGKGRFEIGTVTQDELLDLELSLLNSNLSVTKAKISLKQTRSALNSLLGLEKDITIKCIVPDKIPDLQVDVNEVMKYVLNNNPDLLGYEQQLLEANRRIAETRASGINATVQANIGINKWAMDLDELYTSPFGNEKGVSVGLQMPILDWGERKGKIEMAKSDRDVTEAAIRQQRIDLEQSVIIQVMEFNVQNEQVRISAKADTVAQLGYDVTKQRFMIDKVDVIKLNSARNSLDQARRNYVNSLAQYWKGYFNIRKLTLFDFENNKSLLDELDSLLQQ
ncbi:MAG: TolC family protein [Chlorobi bacterium]|nr:TolC family protein [Chlorobiota bacterium]